MTAILTGEHLVKTYGYNENRVTAVSDISLGIEEGKFTAIIGRSGSGKSTLLHMLAGLLKPTQGSVILNGTDIWKLSDSGRAKLRRRSVGFIFQFFNLISAQNVIENIVLPVHLDNRKEDEEYVNEIIHALGLDDKRYSYIHELSGGQQQRVAIARALASKPSIIFADEPTGNLDAESSKEVILMLRKMQRQYHQTVVMVTHDLNIAENADRIILISDGKIMKDSMQN